MPQKIKLSNDEIRAICYDYIFFDDSIGDLAKNYDFSRSLVKKNIKLGIESCLITHKEANEARQRRRKFVGPKPKLSNDEINALCLDYVLFDDSAAEIAKNYGIHPNEVSTNAKRGIGLRFISEVQLKSARTRRYSQNGKKAAELGLGVCGLTTQRKKEIGRYTFDKKVGIHGRSVNQMKIDGSKGGKMGGKRSTELGAGIHRMTYEQRRAIGKKSAELRIGAHARTHEQWSKDSVKAGKIGGKIGGKRAIESMRKNAYYVENRFHASSQQEGAVALLLEKYVSGYGKVNDGTNFQVKNREINNGGIDFLVENEFLEWHPIILGIKVKGRRADIPEEEMPSYLKVKASLPEEERNQFDADYKEVLAANYFNKRKESIRNSGYNGLDLHLARTPEELYQFIARHSTTLPSLDEFRTEFNQKVKYVKTFKVERKPTEEQKVKPQETPSTEWAMAK